MSKFLLVITSILLNIQCSNQATMSGNEKAGIESSDIKVEIDSSSSNSIKTKTEVPQKESPIVIAEPENSTPPIKSNSPLNESLMLNCDDNEKTMTITAQAGQEIELALTGELCPQIKSQRIMFMVDVSYSMGKQGYDPIQGNTCGRYEAIMAILDRLDSYKIENADIKASLILFTHLVVNEIDFTDLGEFRNLIAPSEICQADGAGGTNYGPAFDQAKDFFTATIDSELKLTYFITDGAPGPNSIEESINSGIKFKEEFTDLKLFQVFLGPTENIIPDPMLQIAQGGGYPSPVERTQTSGDLASILTAFNDVELKKENFTITIDEDTTVPLNSLEKNEKTNTWLWKSNYRISNDFEGTVKLQGTLDNHANIDSYAFDLNINIDRE